MTEVVLINCHIPTGPELLHAEVRPQGQEARGRGREDQAYIGTKYSQMFGDGFMQDVHIWLNKAPVQNPLLCEEDGPVYQLRRWYEQFYVDAADVRPEMTDRFEFEVDTTKANEFWRAEVAENLARKAAEDARRPSQSRPRSDASFVPLSAETLEDQRLYTRRAWSRSPAWTAWRAWA